MPRIPNTTTFTDFHLEDCAQASMDPLPNDDDDAGPRIVIVQHQFSRAQAAYVRARHAEPNAPIFYKDATPRAEHYVRCGVRVEGVDHGVSVPVKLELCFPDGRVVAPTFEPRPGKDADALKVLGDGCKRFVLQSTGGPRFFDYRIELGSLRADDRKFCVKVSPDGPMVAGVLPAVTPGLLVLSKKRIFPGQEVVPVGAGAASPKRPCLGGDDVTGAQILKKLDDAIQHVGRLEEQVKSLTAAVYAAMHPGRPGGRAVVSAAPTPREGLSRSNSFDGSVPARPMPMPAPGFGEQRPESPAEPYRPREGGRPRDPYRVPAFAAGAPQGFAGYVPPGYPAQMREGRAPAPAYPPAAYPRGPGLRAWDPAPAPLPAPKLELPPIAQPGATPPPLYRPSHAELVEEVVGDACDGFAAAAGHAIDGPFSDPHV